MEKMKVKTLGTAILCSAILLGNALLGQVSAPVAPSTADSDVAILKAQLAEQQKQTRRSQVGHGRTEEVYREGRQ
jgi:hypothetical protein